MENGASEKFAEHTFGGAVLDTVLAGRFSDKNALHRWLEAVGFADASLWAGPDENVQSIFDEVEDGLAALELRRSGNASPVLVCLRHTMRLKVVSPSSLAEGKFLLKKWEQPLGGQRRDINSMPSRALRLSDLPITKEPVKLCDMMFSEAFFRVEAADFSFANRSSLEDEDLAPGALVPVDSCLLVDHHSEVWPATSAKGMFCEEHLYTVEVMCSKLPVVTAFTSVRPFTTPTAGTRQMSSRRAMYDSCGGGSPSGSPRRGNRGKSPRSDQFMTGPARCSMSSDLPTLQSPRSKAGDVDSARQLLGTVALSPRRSSEGDARPPLPILCGWTWVNWPKACGELWRTINVQETAERAQGRLKAKVCQKLEELSSQVEESLQKFEESPTGVPIEELASLLRRSMDFAQEALAEYEDMKGATGAGFDLKTQAFVRTKARCPVGLTTDAGKARAAS
eukprot:gnl/TRDRNA2_/TRDRNA2_58732_c0_seq1.p1 gnl/TRDRNA2_/TRDRNA2_58732_c0~~gnl/TRDRNA2_/TRDRNA2_58732_c0_seq1.p1  ORF type:complete len:451 (+),score=87.95 gnl/TRDRNA2_/TRDRNA2_58732_c0_seq1:133-1485(+)